MADRLGVETIDREGSSVVLKFRQKTTTVDPVRLIKHGPRAAETCGSFPPATLKLDLAAPGRDPGR